MLTELDASAVRRWCSAVAEALETHRAEIDELNVFPVPDGDTGTNLALTAQAAAEALSGNRSAGAGEALQAMSRGAVLGARGNSGVILSQVLRGMAESAEGSESIDADALRAALRTASTRAYESVADPVEGTILSVAAAVADALVSDGVGDLAAVSRAALAAAQEALLRTPLQLEVLARAGVVDAGGRGLVVVLEALSGIVTGDQPAALPIPAKRSRESLRVVREEGSAEFDYEVQYLLHATTEAVTALKAALGPLGDSLAVVGTGEDVWNVHVHVNDVGAAIEAGIDAGRPHRISVQRFADQVAAEPRSSNRSGVAVVAVAPGEGLAHLFAGEGVRVVDGGVGNNPSTAEVLSAVRDCGAASVVLLPNASQVAGVADVVAEEARAEGIEVAVVPTKSPVQGLAAVAVYDPTRRFGDLVVAMAETAAATQWGEVTIAVREALTMAGRCQPGDVLGLLNGEVVEIGTDVAEVGERLLDRLLGVGGELVTILLGAEAGEELGARLTARLAEMAPLAEVAVFAGGQPSYPLLIGVE
ncbi:MAG: DAK2 domain-containing protein [Jatrophihabitans sp.]